MSTKLDTRDNLDTATSNQVPQLAEIVTRFAGHMALRLVHDHLLRLDLVKYNKIINDAVRQINVKVNEIKRVSPQVLRPSNDLVRAPLSACVPACSCSLRCSLNP